MVSNSDEPLLIRQYILHKNPSIYLCIFMYVSLYICPSYLSLYPIDIITVLAIPAESISEIEVKIDASTTNPPLTTIFFVITNVGGTDPIAKAQELQELAANEDPRLTSTQNLSGMKVVSVDTEGGEKKNGGASDLVLIVAIVVGKYYYSYYC